ncbi:universal stress protein [Streptomyces sp. NBC_00572]|uniref:universal stress protein n=1 Tax=Streptomyces sp. NBC_00572 TaxID=2903664 RepID=UPI002257697A|nr:universal stress protein [Streptomyces sp. NBC_00572]MCX4986305.1 universal stress protein [Streptomyces sp. NBC_00572]
MTGGPTGSGGGLAPGAVGRVVVGVTGSLASLAALRSAAALARHDGVPLLAVLVWEPPEGEALYARMPDRAWARMWAEDARQRLESAVVDGLGGIPAGLAFEGRAVRGTPAAALRRVADRPGDLLVLGSAPGRGRAARLRRRPVLRAVVKSAGCPVLTVPGPVLLPGEARVLRRNARAPVPVEGNRPGRGHGDLLPAERDQTTG